jgi:hypothetical protein
MDRHGSIIVYLPSYMDIVMRVGVIDGHLKCVDVTITIRIHTDHIGTTNILTRRRGRRIKKVTTVLVYCGRVTRITIKYATAIEFPVYLTSIHRDIHIQVLKPHGVTSAKDT